MLSVVIVILGISFILYTLLGGADFGAGIVEAFTGRKGEKVISKAIAPVWEGHFKSDSTGMGSKSCLAHPCDRDLVYRFPAGIFNHQYIAAYSFDDCINRNCIERLVVHIPAL